MRNVLVAYLVAAVAFVTYLHAADAPVDGLKLTKAQQDRDIIIVKAPGCSEPLACATALHFNGDWAGVKLCRAGVCVRYEEVFSAKRN